MRWPWTRDEKDKEADKLKARSAANNLDSVVQRANRVLDRAELALNDVEKRLGPTNGVNRD